MAEPEYVARVKADLDRLRDDWYRARDEANAKQEAANRAASVRHDLFEALRDKAELYYQLSGEDERYYDCL